MNSNLFEIQPEWIGLDDRRLRHDLVPSPGKSEPSLAYNINPEFMYHRHRVMLPPESIKGKTILDVGSCMGATGAWCLHNGAAHYTGIEKFERYANASEQLFQKYHNTDHYDIKKCGIEEFETDKKYDIVIVSGLLYAMLDSVGFLKKLSSFTDNKIIFDTVHPFNGYRRLFPTASDEERKRLSKLISITQITERIRMQGEKANGSVKVTGSMVSLPALIILMKQNGFEYQPELYTEAEKEIPYYYDITNHIRFMAEFNYVGKQIKEPEFKGFGEYVEVKHDW